MFKTFLGKRRAIISTAALLALTATATASSVPGPGPRLIRPSVSQGFRTNVSPQGYDCSTGTTAPFYCLGGENDSALNGFTYGVYGVEGYAPNATGGVGVLGYSGKSSVSGAYGVYGVTFASNGIGVYGAGDGPAPTGTPSSTQSTGVVGNSASGDGVYGSTQFPNISSLGQVGGVFGVDVTTTGHENNGVVGITTNGGWGVVGLSSSANSINALGGVYGSGTGGEGVEGDSSTYIGVYGSSGSFNAIQGVGGQHGVVGYSSSTATPAPTSAPFTYAGTYGQSSYGPGVYGVDVHNTGAIGYGISGLTADRYPGLYGFGNDGAGVYAYSFSDFGGLITNDSSVFPTLYINSDNTTSGAYEIAASAGDITSDAINFHVDRVGDLYAAGSITSGTDTYQARTRNPGSDLTTYSAQHTEATVEDFGSAQLVGGVATVPLAADFRQTINTALPYMVFLTPYGDNRGLYIASRTAAGFVVKEAQSGRSTLSFDYRIVARPYGSVHARLPHAEAELAGQKAGFGRAMSAMPRRPSESAMGSPALTAKQTTFERSRQAGAIRPQVFVPRPNLTAEYRSH